MINKNIAQYFRIKWSAHYKTVTETSKIDDTKSLVIANNQEYKFDDIIQETFSDNNCPNSVDAVRFVDNGCFFVEYKSGFRDNITVKNLQSPVKCTDYQGVECTRFYEFYCDARNKAKGALILALEMKAIESYVFLEKYILPLSGKPEDKIPLILHIVIDIDPVERMIEIQKEVLTEKESKNINIKKINDSFKRLKNCFKSYNKSYNDDYYFDEVKVWSSSEYEIYLKKILNKKTPSVSI